MARYEKRQGKRVKLNKKSPARPPAEKPERIRMAHTAPKKPAPPKKQSKEQPTKNYRVLQGRKPKKSAVLLGVLAVIALFVIVCQLALPTGILEYLQNSYALHATNGSGKEALMGTSFLQMNARYGRIDLLSGAYYEVYNTAGDTAYTVQHGLSAPVMVSSPARTLVYDRDGSELNVYNLSKQKQQLTVDGQIYTAAISRSGSVAVAYKSNDYLSVVQVYTKTSKQLFTHNFAEEYVTTVSMNASGRYLTVTTLYTKGGIYHTNLYLFDAKKQTQISKVSYDDMYFTASEALSHNTTLAVSYDKAVVATPGKGTVTALDIPEKISNYAVSANGTVAFVCNQADNAIDNKIRVFDKQGQKKTEFDFVGTVNGFSVSNTHIYILSDAVLHSYAIKDLKHTGEAFENAQLLSAFHCGAAAVANAKLQIKNQ